MKVAKGQIWASREGLFRVEGDTTGWVADVYPHIVQPLHEPPGEVGYVDVHALNWVFAGYEEDMDNTPLVRVGQRWAYLTGDEIGTIKSINWDTKGLVLEGGELWSIEGFYLSWSFVSDASTSNPGRTSGAPRGLTDDKVWEVLDVLENNPTEYGAWWAADVGPELLSEFAERIRDDEDRIKKLERDLEAMEDRWQDAEGKHFSSVQDLLSELNAVKEERDILKGLVDDLQGALRDTYIDDLLNRWRLVERDGKPWPPAQEPERPRPGEKWRSNQDGSVLTVESVTSDTVRFVEHPLPEDLTLFMHHCRRVSEAPAQEPVAVVPATDDDLAYYEEHPGPLSAQRVGELVARFRQEQAALLQTNGWLRDAERERDEALDRVAEVEAANERAVARADEAVARCAGLEETNGQLEHSIESVVEGITAVREQRDEAVARAEFSEVERDEAVERAKAAEDYYLMKLRAVKERAETWEKRWERQTEALARVERVTALEHAVIDVAGKWYAGPHLHDAGHLVDLCNAVRALRDAQEAGS